MASHFVWTNRSKESLTLDVKHAEGSIILQKLVSKADVVVQNLAPGAAARLGLGYTAISKDNPGVIVCNISGYGTGGPDEKRKAYDLLVQSESGFVTTTGTPDTPSKAGISIADIAADPHYRARGVIETVRAQSGIDVEMPGVVPKLSGTPGAVQASAPRLGQHTRDVLRSHGLTDAQIDALAAQGVVAEAAG